MVVRFTTTYAISTYYHQSYELESHSGGVYTILHYVIKFVRNLRANWLFSPVFTTNKTDRHDIIEILLKVTLNTINPVSVKRVTRDIGIATSTVNKAYNHVTTLISGIIFGRHLQLVTTQKLKRKTGHTRHNMKTKYKKQTHKTTQKTKTMSNTVRT